MKSILVSIAIFFFSTLLHSQHLRISEPAPPINITQWVGNSQGENLNGKYIVLEFWTSWCAPCLAAVPHMNELQSSLNSDEIVFLSLTNESESKIEKTLERIDFHSHMVIDTTDSTFRNYGDEYGPAALPMTVLIDKQGIVQWIGQPQQLSTEILKDFLNETLEGSNLLNTGKKNGEASSSDNLESKPMEDDPLLISKQFKKLMQDTLQKTHFDIFASIDSTSNKRSALSQNGVALADHKLKEIFFELFDETVVVSPDLKDIQYNVLFKDTLSSIAALESKILKVLDVEKIETSIPIDYIVTLENKSKLNASAPNGLKVKTFGQNLLVCKPCSISELIYRLNNHSAQLIHYAGDDSGTYDFIVNLSSLHKNLQTYGIKLSETTESVEGMMLRRKLE